MKKALVLSGGGAKGGFQVGALKAYLEKYGNLDFDIISGVSVGSLNGCLLAMGKYDVLVDIWSKITQRDIFTKYSILKVIWNVLIKRKNGAYDNAPLLRILEKHITLADLKTEFIFGVVSLYDGKYYSLSSNDFDDDNEFRKAILASSTMPIVWSPVRSIRTKFGVIRDVVDGGIRTVSPLGDVLKINPTDIVIINCAPTGIDIEPDSKSLLKVAKRAITNIMIDEIEKNDLDMFLKINELVKSNNISGYTYYENKLVTPEVIGGTLDFSRDTLDNNYHEGYRRGIELL